MTEKEFNNIVASFRKQGMSDEDILGGLYRMAVDGKLSVDDLKDCASKLGYDLADDVEERIAKERAASSGDIMQRLKGEIDEKRTSSKDYMDRFTIIYRAVNSNAITEEQSAELLDYAGLVYVNHLVIEKDDPVFEEARKVITEMKAEGAGDALIIGQALSQFQHGNVSFNYLGVVMDFLDHQFNSVFLQMSPEDQAHASLSDLDAAFPAPARPKRKRSE